MILAALLLRSFSEVVRALELQLETRLGEEDAPRIRLRPSLSLAFPRSDLADLQVEGAIATLTTTFLGLYGVSSPLPGAYAEHLAAREAEAGGARTRAVLDLFHQRLLTLLYQATRRYRLRGDPARDPLLETLLTLAGRIPGTPPPRGGLAELALLYGWARSAYGLERLLCSRLSRPVRVRELEPRRFQVRPSERTALGQPTARLGSTWLLGAQVFDRGGLAIHLEAVTPAELLDFGPGGSGFAEIERTMLAFAPSPLTPRLKLEVTAPPPWHLGRTALGGNAVEGRAVEGNALGRSTWLGAPQEGARVSHRLLQTGPEG